MSKETGIFWCFSCQESKTLEELLIEVTKKSYFEVIRLIDSSKDDRKLLDKLSNTLETKKKFVEFDKELIKTLHTNLLNNDRAQKYLSNRGIKKDSAIKYIIGYSEKQDMVTIPIYSADNLCLGFVGRSIQGKVFKNTLGLPKSKTLFNLQNAKRHDRVFIVESSFDAIRLEQVGVHAVATLGATISKEQRSLLKQYFNQIILIADNDDAGKLMSNKLNTEFGLDCIMPKLPKNVKDISDMSDDDIRCFISELDDIGSLMVKLTNAHL